MRPKLLLVLLLIVVNTVAVWWLLGRPASPDDDRIDPAWLTACGQDDKNARVTCWKDLFETVIKTRGIASALTLMGELNQQDKRFVENCHDITHTIGLRAYELFSRHKPFGLNERTAYCSFGFYHGFMETLVIRSGDPAKAREFCTYVGTQLKDKIPDAYYACFHGIGHGWANVHDQQNWGNEHAIVDPALALCEQVADPADSEQLLRCATGVFDSVSLAYYNGLAGLTMRADNPLWLCQEQPERYKGACYRDLMPAVLWYGEYDLARAAQIVERHAESDYAEIAMMTLADDSVRFIPEGKSAVDLLPVCRKRRSDLVSACVLGLGHGAVQFGIADREYESGFAFCRHDGLTQAERTECYTSVLQFATQRYSREKAAAVCGQAPAEYRSHCGEQGK